MLHHNLISGALSDDLVDVINWMDELVGLSEMVSEKELLKAEAKLKIFVEGVLQ